MARVLLAVVLIGCAGETPAVDAPVAGDAGVDAAGDVVYQAVWLATALDRIRITRADAAADRCAELVLVSPSVGGDYPLVATPVDWTVEQAGIQQGTDCPSGAAVAASGATGIVSFTAFGDLGFPCEIDLAVTLSFDPGEPWIPPTETLETSDLPVTGTSGCP